MTTRSRYTPILLALVFVLGVASTASARDATVRLGALVTVTNTQQYVDMMDTHLLSSFDLSASFELLEDLLFIEAGYMAGGQSDDTLLGNATVDLSFDAMTLGARYEHKLFPWLRPYGSVEGILTKADWSLDYDGTTFQTDPWLMGLGVHLGAMAYIPTKRLLQHDELGKKFSVGLYVDIGYTVMQSIDLDGLTSTRKTAMDKDPVDLGELPMGGFVYGLGVVVML